ncbi:MAG: LysM peptidoglycan-binding domain-containing protein [Candidatus Omnitrophica bacterium]|nr:LysM peptidoglycan-binding domain-containing protein [Candidatus Omnitrophota bacterium]
MRKNLLILFVIIGVICLIVGILFLRANIGKKGALVSEVTEADIAFRQANAYFSKGRLEEAEHSYKEIIKDFPNSKRAMDSLYMLALLYERKGQLLESRASFSEFLLNRPDVPHSSDIRKKIWELNMRILFSPTLTADSLIYEVKFGDTLNSIARKFNTTAELIIRANNLTNPNIKTAMKLKIQTSKFSILIDKSENTLALKSNDEIIKLYPIATGSNNSTPTGAFKIINKLVNPPWYTEKGIIPPQSPENILGTRWLGLSKSGYGIHGTTEPKTIGSQCTLGCVRMLNQNVEELYSILPVGTEVTIVD